MLKKIVPAIMIGGSGTRLWPLSRENMPKQFLRLTNEHSLFQNTLFRVADELFDKSWLLTSAKFLDLVEAQIKESKADYSGMILEPMQRGTAAALASIAVTIAQTDKDKLILAMPADHVIENPDRFRQEVRRAIPMAENGKIVTFGIVPTSPETGFGYIKPSEDILVDGVKLGSSVSQPGGFEEKPDLQNAEKFLASGYLWNAGIFLFKASVLLEEMATYAPATLSAVTQSILSGKKTTRNDRRLVTPTEAEFDLCPIDLAIDKAVMEKSHKVAVVDCDKIGWADIGSLSALWEIYNKDQNGNAVRGKGFAAHSKNCLIYSTTGRNVVVSYASEMMVIDTEDTVVVIPRHEAQKVKDIIGALKILKSPEVNYTKSGSFYWGKVKIDRTNSHNRVSTVSMLENAKLNYYMQSGSHELWVLNRTAPADYIVDGVRKTFLPGIPVSFALGDNVTIDNGDSAAEFTHILHEPVSDITIADWFIGTRSEFSKTLRVA